VELLLDGIDRSFGAMDKTSELNSLIGIKNDDEIFIILGP
jgi:hypothetical protein